MSASPAVHQMLLFVLAGKDPLNLSKEDKASLKVQAIQGVEYQLIPNADKEDNPLKKFMRNGKSIIANPHESLKVDLNSSLVKETFYSQFVEQLTMTGLLPILRIDQAIEGFMEVLQLENIEKMNVVDRQLLNVQDKIYELE